MRFGRDDTAADAQVVTRIDHLDEVLREHIVTDLIPRIGEHNRLSINTDKVEFYFYQRLSFGRRCSCWTEVDSSSDKKCPLCYGVGFVTGFAKYGTTWECLDPTAPSVTLVNVAPDYDGQHRPAPWVLTNGAVRGYIEWSVQIGTTTGMLDLLKLVAYAPDKSRIILYVRTSSESTFTEVTGRSDVEDRLTDTSGSPNKLVFRILLARGRQARSPIVLGLHLRYRRLAESGMRVPADVPRDSETTALAELGLMDQWSSIMMVLGNKITNISNSDFFHRIRDGRRYKVFEMTSFRPEGVLVGHDVQARIVQSYENYHMVP